MAVYDFNPERLAYYEAAGWRAYYEHNWLRLLRLLVGICQEQFRIPFPVSLLAAYYMTRASATWVAVDHNAQKVRALHEKFYQIAKRYSGLEFDPARAAELEEQYWDVHRRLAAAKQNNKVEFVETMVDLHSVVFGISREQAHESAELRVLANNTVDLITSKTSADPEADWAKLENFLRQCYRSIRRQKANMPESTGMSVS
jgi:hypothetical protein